VSLLKLQSVFTVITLSLSTHLSTSVVTYLNHCLPVNKKISHRSTTLATHTGMVICEIWCTSENCKQAALVHHIVDAANH